jgi:hypothetical protein
MLSFGMLRRVTLVRTDLSVALVRTDISEECTSSPILVTLMMEGLLPLKRRFLQEPHCGIFQKIATAVKTSDLT